MYLLFEDWVKEREKYGGMVNQHKLEIATLKDDIRTLTDKFKSIQQSKPTWQ